MLAASSFAFHVTYTCPLECAHCCFGSGPAVKDRLDPQAVIDMIDSLPEGIRMVAFTGGEPFLFGAHLVRFVAAAKARGYTTRVVTSAYFGTNPKAARMRMQPLQAVGLDELSISWDDYHEAFVAFAAIRNVAEVAVEMGITTAINCVLADDSTWTRSRILAEIGPVRDQLTVIAESQLNLTGRAEEELADKPFKANGYLGPCPYVLTGPTLSAKNKLLACCGVLPNMQRLVIEDNPRPDNIAPAIDRSFSNPLLLYLFLRGPYSLLRKIANRYAISVPDGDRIGGNCEACKLLFQLGDIERHIDSVLEDELETLAGELLLLDSLALLDPKGLQTVWGRESVVRIGL